jgi:hypothetical protein
MPYPTERMAAGQPDCSRPQNSPESAPESWHQDAELVRGELVERLADRGVEVGNLRWLSADEASSVLQAWTTLGPRRYGTLALMPHRECQPCAGPGRRGPVLRRIRARNLVAGEPRRTRRGGAADGSP